MAAIFKISINLLWFLCVSIVLVAVYSSGNTDADIVVTKKNATSLRFMVVGDWGGLPTFPYRTYIESGVASQMGKLATQLNIHAVLTVGDNFYFEGVKDVNDKRFKETYEDVFTSPALQRIPWYVIAGNHDWHGNVSAQIAYSNKSKSWTYPKHYYKVHYAIRNVTVDIIMLDTIILCGDVKHDFLTAQPGGASDLTAAQAQLIWLQHQLSNSRADYLLVAGHYPVFSAAEHGPTHCLVEKLLPSLYKYNVSAYLCGHDHNLQHLQYTRSGWTVDYFLSGASNFIDASLKHKNDVPPNSLKFHWADYLSLGGFGHMEITPHALDFTFFEANGKVLHRQRVKPRKVLLT